MPSSESVFAVLFAIFWGSIMNVSGRWRMFQPFVWHGRIACRFALSFVVMLALPIFYFALVYQCINGSPLKSEWDVARAVLPSLFIYVCYRLWMALVGSCPRLFYWDPAEAVPNFRLRHIDPNPKLLGLPPHGYGPLGNYLGAAAYLWLALRGPWLVTEIESLFA